MKKLSARIQVLRRAEVGDCIVDVAWNAAGTQVAAAAVHGPLVILAVTNPAEPIHLPGHAGGALALAWTAANVLASGGQDGHVRWWDVSTGALNRAEAAGSPWVGQLAVSATGILASGAGRSVRMWNDKGELLRAWAPRASTVNGMQWHPQQSILAASHYGGISLLLESCPADQDEDRLLPLKGSQLQVVWSPTGAWIATATQDRAVHMWRVMDADDCEMTGFPEKIQGLLWYNRGSHLISVSGTEVLLWDCRGAGPMGRSAVQAADAEVHAHLIQATALEPESRWLATGDSSGKVVIWKLGIKDHLTRSLETWQAAAGISALRWSPDGATLAVGDEHGQLTLLNLVGFDRQ